MRFSKSLLKNMSKLTDITKIWFGALPDSSNLNPFRIYYHQDGCEKNYDLLKTAVRKFIILIYNETTEKFIFKKKFSPSVYYDFVGKQFDVGQNIALEIFPPSLGESFELFNCIQAHNENACALIKNQLKMAGYSPNLVKIEKIITFKSGVGHSSSYETLFYCKVKDEYKIPDSEIEKDDVDFEIVEYSLYETDVLLKDFRVLNCTPDLLFSVLWVLKYKIRFVPTEINNPPVFMHEMVTD